MQQVRREALRNWMIIAAVIVIADQITKYIATVKLEMYESIAVMPMFNFTLMHNEGAAFSFLSDAGGWQRWFFTIISFVVSIVLIVWIKKLKPEEKCEALAFSFILGGAVGNLIDRVYWGYVIDFIDIYYNKSHWPAFNIADSAITIGVVILIVDTIFPNLFKRN
ncbi:Lipoprotein signal peptidase [hydrothermal vent metagenome]|uniref:Lipoprotein signal peptidase n=1 Tax=hydrothermal vent metagenome TaxID=652676 RepID=A0A3B1AF12_9ZZZZ